MLTNSRIRLALTWALVASSQRAGAQGGPAGGLYQIVSGDYVACCGIAGEIHASLPDENQSYVRLTLDPQSNLASLSFVVADGRTIASVASCPPENPLIFSLDHGFVSMDGIVFHVDPGPPPYSVYWNYLVSNSAGGLRINGTLGTAAQFCADVPTQFSHTNVVAVPVPGPWLTITEWSKDGPLLRVQGNAGWTDVIEASADAIVWTPISTNLMPNTVCPVCPYVQFRDAPSTNAGARFYRCFEVPFP